MKCISKSIAIALTIVCAVGCLCGCSDAKLVMEYKSANNTTLYSTDKNTAKLSGMAANLCVASGQIIPEGMGTLQASAGLFDLTNQEVLYANNIHERMYPASITKIMTALLLFESYSGDFTDTVVASENVKITESGAQLCGFQQGDSLTIDQLLHGLLVYSGNDAAVMIAEYVAGSEEAFVEMMNQRAIKLGATNTHFTNPHGLSDENHYTTAYDLYLMFNKVMQYDKFREVIGSKSYESEYTTAAGTAKKISLETTNLFLKGEKEVPQNAVVIGGKTGTTSVAGSCLILLSQNTNGNDYISVILKAENKNSLYSEMTELLQKIN